jgi:hypothetical protein
MLHHGDVEQLKRLDWSRQQGSGGLWLKRLSTTSASTASGPENWILWLSYYFLKLVCSSKASVPFVLAGEFQLLCSSKASVSFVLAGNSELELRVASHS